ncbi:acetyl-CoA carboxylase carboxyltransferase subunit alpha [Paenibacillus koleovorans]|uniref:acetyl-CoA carboxylase carboxyltransferase subunit alpha n=1 Tax=Paenibacillus koleovorans TaxID=121608 RepID=UPI000FD93259|nr:acetyl-CoA carboxylase carboxyltransferase subunit alpha [Paenibacillus koleovorans]
MSDMPFERPLVELRSKIDELKKFGNDKQIDFTDEIAKLEERYSKLEEELYAGLSAREKLQIARHPLRLKTLDYINRVFTDFIEFHGDRAFRDDLAIVGGIAKLNGIPVTVVGHQKGVDTKDNIARNFGSPHPEGFRKALRLMQQANKFGRPIVTFLDTKGAAPDTEAEERGAGEAIARNLLEMAGFRVPVICVVIGEGGSGGALALGVGNRVLMMENAVYSVISPEGAATILYKDATQSLKAAERMKITATDLLGFKVIDEIIREPRGGAHRDPEQQAAWMKDALWRNMQELRAMSGAELQEDRYRKFRAMGRYSFLQELVEQR